jgi:2,4-dienoyl-CoA reductase-like NADH-dependent reductase (Old Yellow Enzyme family)/thioredoxin reductase
MQLRNRIVMPPMGTRYSSFGGWPTTRSRDYYAARARGGVGLIVMEFAGVTRAGRGAHHTGGLYDDRMIPHYRMVTDAIHQHGAKAALQLAHSGAAAPVAVMGVQPVGPSNVPLPGGDVPRAMTRAEIHELVEAFGKAAARAVAAGFDAVSLHMAHGYLLNQFLTPYLNRRTDEYGSDLTGRARFPLEVLRRVKEVVGEEVPVICRLSGDDFVPGGLTLDESRQVARMLEESGADAIHVAGGIPPATHMSTPPMALPAGALVHLAAGIKGMVRVPVIAVGKIHDPLLAEQVLQEGKADLIAVGRGLIADPAWAAKAQAGKLDAIRPCVACNQPLCHGRLFHQGVEVSCVVNPRVGREAQFPMKKASPTRRVLVVGGGLGGMEAALIAAQRGHQVVLCEKEDRLGGQMLLATVPPHKEDLRKLLRYFAHQLKAAAVMVQTGRTVTLELVREMAPNVVILATGARPHGPDVPGAERAVSAWDVLAGRVEVGERVVVMGGGDVGCETGEYLAAQGHRVTILEMLPDIASELIPWTRNLLFQRLADLQVEVLTRARVIAIGEGEVIYDRVGVRHRLEADTVVLATGARPDRGLADALSPLEGVEVHLVGDCVEPRTAAEAIREGFEIACAI